MKNCLNHLYNNKLSQVRTIHQFNHHLLCNNLINHQGNNFNSPNHPNIKIINLHNLINQLINKIINYKVDNHNMDYQQINLFHKSLIKFKIYLNNINLHRLCLNLYNHLLINIINNKHLHNHNKIRWLPLIIKIKYNLNN